MTAETIDLKPWGPAIQAYLKWIEPRDITIARRWCNRLHSADSAQVEASLGEAVAWDYLKCRVDAIDLWEDASVGGPDFRCTQNGNRFIVEITNLSRETVTRVTGLDNLPGFKNYQNLTARIKSEVSAKAAQCAGLSVPAVVFVTTFHRDATIHCVCRDHVSQLLTSRTGVSGDYDDQKGQIVGPLRHSTNMALSTFRCTRPVFLRGFPERSVVRVSHPHHAPGSSDRRTPVVSSPRTGFLMTIR